MDNIKPQIQRLKEREVLLKNNTQWLYFTEPYHLITAETLDEVLPALRQIEQLTQTNHWYAAGFISYEAAHAFDSTLETRPSTALLNEGPSLRSLQPWYSPGARINNFPYLWFGLYPRPRFVALPAPESPRGILDWHPTVCREDYSAAVEKIKDHIAEGRTYQVNYTMRLQTPFTGDAWEFFLHLVQYQNQHAAYIDAGRYIICSASPELFFQLDGDTITCRPMKGTIPRGRTTTEDQQQSDTLKHSTKNRAENVMIVDMIRNDLGRIAEIGSVSVSELFEMERYPTLWQMTSTVCAQTSASLTEILTALFPCASITGAPKVSTMKIITELESTPRKVYTGTIGYIAPQRKAKFNVAIRTALIDRGLQKAEYGVGGGIVWDSTGPDEYAEALLKAGVLTQGPQQFSLLETLLWKPAQGFFLRQKHLDRMLDSAGYFDFPITKENLVEYLEQISSTFRTTERVRVWLDQYGTLAYETSPFQPSQNTGTLKVRLAKEPIDSNDIFLFHKTTQRQVYEAARRGLEGFDDVLLYNEKNELTEFTIGNLIVELGGQFFTPPVSCGLLPGTFRAHVLETGQVRERTILRDELSDCRKIFRVNSIRRWQIVEIQG